MPRGSRSSLVQFGPFASAGAETALTVLKAFDENVTKPRVDLSTTCAEVLIVKANAAGH